MKQLFFIILFIYLKVVIHRLSLYIISVKNPLSPTVRIEKEYKNMERSTRQHHCQIIYRKYRWYKRISPYSSSVVAPNWHHHWCHSYIHKWKFCWWRIIYVRAQISICVRFWLIEKEISGADNEKFKCAWISNSPWYFTYYRCGIWSKTESAGTITGMFHEKVLKWDCCFTRWWRFPW